VNSFETYKLFLGLNNHFFIPSYDYFKYGPPPVKPDTFRSKPEVEQYRFERLGKKFSTKIELENFITASLIESPKKMWIGQFSGGDADENYLKWQGRTQALRYNLTTEIKRLAEENDGFNCLFAADLGQHPDIVKARLRKDISLESFSLLDMCVMFSPRLSKNLEKDRTWMILRNLSDKYQPVLSRLGFSLKDMRKGLLEAIQSVCDQ